MINTDDHFNYYARRLHRKNAESRIAWGEPVLKFEEYLNANLDFIKLGYAEYLKVINKSEAS